MTMTTTLNNQGIDSVDPLPAAAKARGRELIDIHRRAGHLVAELSDGPAWVDADHITTRLIAEAEAVAATGAPVVAPAVPAVVRCRELAAAQGRLFRALKDDDGLDVGEAAVVRTRALLAELTEVAAGQRATVRR